MNCVPALRDELVEGGLREHQLGLEGVPVEAVDRGEVAECGDHACVESELQETQNPPSHSRFLAPAPAPPPVVGEGEAEGAVEDVEEVVVAGGHDQQHEGQLRRERQLLEADRGGEEQERERDLDDVGQDDRQLVRPLAARGQVVGKPAVEDWSFNHVIIIGSKQGQIKIT